MDRERVMARVEQLLKEKCYFVKRFLIGFKKFFYFFLNIPENGRKVKRRAGE